MSLLEFNAIRDNNHTIWGTAECDAWSRSFGYEDYLRLHEVHKNTLGLLSKPVSPTTYAMLGLAFHNQMEEDFESIPIHEDILSFGKETTND